MRESRCSFPWWKRGLGDDRQQGERDLQGGRRVGDRERPIVARCPRAYWQDLKRLLVEKSIDVIAPSHAFVCDVEEICISEPDLCFNVPKNMEESKVKFE